MSATAPPLNAASSLATAQRTYVRYREDVEVAEDGEEQLFEDIITAMRAKGRLEQARSGHASRASHAKSHGLARAQFQVLDGLPAELRQGLFAEPRHYPAIVRLAGAQGETPCGDAPGTRGMAIKVVGVSGPMLAGHEGRATQDFLLDTGAVFSCPGPKEFLSAIRPHETAAAAQVLRRVAAVLARAGHAALNKPGDETAAQGESRPVASPLEDIYYSQTPYRYGDYMAKIRVSAVVPRAQAPADQKPALEADDAGLQDAVARHIGKCGAEFEIAVQLCTDLLAMPIENASTEWPQQTSPYRPVARLVIEPQDTYSPARQAYVDETLSFCPAHSLQAHRPLGGINRARLKAYAIMAGLRRIHNRVAINEPRSMDELPG